MRESSRRCRLLHVQLHVTVEGLLAKFDEEIDIAVGPGIASRMRTEQRKFPHTEYMQAVASRAAMAKVVESNVRDSCGFQHACEVPQHVARIERCPDLCRENKENKGLPPSPVTCYPQSVRQFLNVVSGYHT